MELNILTLDSEVLINQSIVLNYNVNGDLTIRKVKNDYLDYSINGDSLICKSKNSVFSILTHALTLWSYGTSVSYLITSVTGKRVILINKYVFEFEMEIEVKALDLPIMPIVGNDNNLSLSDVSGHFEWYRNNQLFSIVISCINTTLEGNLKKINVV